MSVCYAAVTGIKSGGSNEAGYNSVKVTSVSTKELSFYVSLDETASFFVIVFGKQLQWGKFTGSPGNNSIPFPLSFTSFATVVATGSDNNYYNYYIASIDNSKFVFWKENSKGSQITWLAAGK